jgi:hypothetical protein
MVFASKLQKDGGTLTDALFVVRDEERCLSYMLVKRNLSSLPAPEQACNPDYNSGPSVHDLEKFVELAFSSPSVGCRLG